MAITVNFACNDPRNGDCLGKFERFDVDGGDLHMEFEGPETEIKFDFPITNGYGVVTVGNQQFHALAYRNWYGNWCWDAACFSWDVALAIINHLGASGDWRMTEGPCSLFDAFDARHQITPQEWKDENEAKP